MDCTCVFSQLKVVTAYGGNEALLKVEKTLPDLILLDIMMPDMDGYEVCKEIKSNKRKSEIIAQNQILPRFFSQYFKNSTSELA